VNRRAASLSATWFAVLTAPAFAEIDVPPQPSVDSQPLQEIVISAPEPRYVAPTRRDSIGRIWAPVMINEQGPFRLVLDTGASHSGIIDSVAGRLGIDLAKAPKVRLRGVTGTAEVPMVRVNTLTVGELALTGSRLPIVIDALGGAEGVLGTEGLEDKRIYIDFKNDLISITYSRNERPGPDYITVPLQNTTRRLLLINASVGGIRTTAMIDTGGQASIGNLALREALLRRRSDVKPTQDRIIGATADVQEGDGYPAPPIDFDRIRIQGSHVTFGDMSIFQHWGMVKEPAILIGMDTLGLLDSIIIDYRRREIDFRLRADVSRASF
jgi:predicted aspartyl protease